MMYGTKIINPRATDSIALTRTAPALTSLAYFMFNLYSFDIVSHTASITLLKASEINTKAIRNATAIQCVWDMLSSIERATTITATSN